MSKNKGKIGSGFALQKGEVDDLAQYFTDVGGFSLLNRDEEVALSIRIKAGDAEAREQMINSNLRLVVHVAKKYRNRGMAFEDLIQEGNIGLFKAVDKFDHELGNRFSTYAVWWIRRGVVRAIENTSRTIRVPAYIQELISKSASIKKEFMKSNGNAPTDSELAEGLGVSVEYLAKIKKAEALRTIGSIDNGSSDDGGSLSEILESDDLGPYVMAAMEELPERLERAVATLPTIEQNVLRMRFGVAGNSSRLQKEIAETLGVSRENVRDHEVVGLTNLKVALRAQAGALSGAGLADFAPML